MSKATIIIVSIIILIFGGLVAWSIFSSPSKAVDYDQYDASKIIQSNDDNGQIGDHVRGDIGSPVVFLEYGDFQCAGCASIQTSVETLFEEYGDRVAFIFRNFPIKGHQNARAAAAAAESAGFQGYFFDMAAIIYANQAAWSYASGSERTDIFTDLFRQIAPDGDVEKFTSDMADTNITKKINFDYDLGAKLSGVTGTPSFHINGESVDLSSSSTASDFSNAMHVKLDAKLKEFNLPTGAATTTSQTE